MEVRNKCTLNDTELIERCKEWISRLCKTGGLAWSLRVPVDFNNDPDILFYELTHRLEKKLSLEDAIELFYGPRGTLKREAFEALINQEIEKLDQ